MLTVWKYPLGPGFSEIEIPEDANVLSVVFEPKPLNGEPGGVFLYVLVDSSALTERRGFTLAGTGIEVEVPEGRELGRFIGTVGDGFWFHVFEVM